MTAVSTCGIGRNGDGFHNLSSEHEKIVVYPNCRTAENAMEAEQINTLSNLIDDLQARVGELRRYL